MGSVHRRPTWDGEFTHVFNFLQLKTKGNFMLCLTNKVGEVRIKDTFEEPLLIKLVSTEN